MQQIDARRATRQDTFDLRYDQGEGVGVISSDEERSVLEDDSDGEDDKEDYIDDDGSSDLSIPNESIDFDLVYALHSFAATVEGQANVVKGDSLFLMDDSNSYWWLVRVLKTQEVGYIPAENIETPFERLARLNKHRNVDVRVPFSTTRCVHRIYFSAAGICNPCRTRGNARPPARERLSWWHLAITHHRRAP